MIKHFWREPLEKAFLKKQLVAYKHKSFWQCVDTKRSGSSKKNFPKK